MIQEDTIEKEGMIDREEKGRIVTSQDRETKDLKVDSKRWAKAKTSLSVESVMISQKKSCKSRLETRVESKTSD